jgi:hypothetical protein
MMSKFQIIILVAAFIGLLAIVIYIAGGTERKLKKELRQLIEIYPYSATGSDLMLAIFGWPSSQKLHLKTLSVALDLQATLKSGSATAIISASADTTEYNVQIWFSYFKSYMGSHGVGGGMSLGLSNFQRENEVPDNVCCPERIKTINAGDSITDSLTNQSLRLPDGALAKYYQIKTERNISELEFELEAENKQDLQLKTVFYKDKKMISGYRLRTAGTFIILVTGGTASGRYSLKVPDYK